MLSNNNQHEIQEENEDSLSLCNFSLDQESEDNVFPDRDNKLLNRLSNQDFEFSTPNSKAEPKLDNIIFCGRTMSCKMETHTNPLYGDGNSLLRSSSAGLLSKSSRSKSFHVQTTKPSLLPYATGSFSYDSRSSRKHKFMIGLAKLPLEMELSDIRERQSRKAPVPMFPAKLPSDETIKTTGSEGSKKKKCCLHLPLKCRSYLSKWLTKSYLGCLPQL